MNFQFAGVCSPELWEVSDFFEQPKTRKKSALKERNQAFVENVLFNLIFGTFRPMDRNYESVPLADRFVDFGDGAKRPIIVEGNLLPTMGIVKRQGSYMCFLLHRLDIGLQHSRLRLCDTAFCIDKASSQALQCRANVEGQPSIRSSSTCEIVHFFSMVNMITHWFCVFALVVAFLVYSGPLLAASEIIIAYANISARVSPLWIAQEKGFFSKYGVNTQQVYMPGSPVMIASMASGQVHIANSGGTAALGAAAGGLDLRVIGTFTSHIPFDLVVKPNIKTAKDLRGKRIGVQVIGGTIWMGAMLGLEHLGLDARSDDIQIVAAGDQTMLSQALEKGTVDATVVDSAFSNTLKQRGFPILVELSKTKIPFVSNGIIARASYLQQQPEAARNTLKAWLEGVAYALSPKMKPSVIETISARLKVSNPALAEQGYQDLLRATDRKPYPSLEGLSNVQRLMKLRNPAVAGLKPESLVDARLIQELDQSGFIDQLYSAYGVR